MVRVNVRKQQAVIFACGLLIYAPLSPLARAQDNDTAIFHDDRKTLTVLSEIEDGKEREAFLAAYQATGPAERRVLARAFLSVYPQSWLLAQAYDLAARASIDSGDYETARRDGRMALRLMPENPILAVLMANLEAQLGRTDEGASLARAALEYLDQFSRPANATDKEWAGLKPQLKASAYFALGRAYAARGMRDRTGHHEDLSRALEALNHAAAWNGNDPEIFYLRGLVEHRLGQRADAISDLNWVTHATSPLSATAMEELGRLREGGSGKVPFSGAAKPRIDVGLREELHDSAAPAAIQAGYAGSAKCASCHPPEYEGWRQSGMARMLREYRRENVAGDFSPSARFANPADRNLIRVGESARPYFEVLGANGQWQRFFVDYTIGSKWQQGYATKTSDGSFYVLPIQYNFEQKAWINYWKIIDPPDSRRARIQDFPQLSSATSYQENCAVCHTSQLRAAQEAGNNLSHAQFREPGIDCEMCHGPAALHASRMRKGESMAKLPLESPVNFGKIGNRDGVRICAQCHRQSSIRELGPRREMNYSAVGASFVPPSLSRVYDAFSRRAFFKDGRFRETTFIVEAFTRSACYRRGTAQCTSCHSGHAANFPSNLTALKFTGSADEMCLGCHEQYRTRLTRHTRHAAESEGSRCVACHMPRIVNALQFKARSHQIEIPTADLTERFGQVDSPNACLLCHAKKEVSWVRSQLQGWKPERAAECSDCIP